MVRQVTCGLGTHTQSQSVNEIGTDHRGDRSYVHFTAVAGLNEILTHQLQGKECIFEESQASDTVHKITHAFLALGHLHLAVFIPEGVILHLGIRIFRRLRPPFEELVGNGVEGIVREAGGTDSHALMGKLKHDEFYHQVIFRQHPLTRRQWTELLNHA